jgi:hypothetical protein
LNDDFLGYAGIPEHTPIWIDEKEITSVLEEENATGETVSLRRD